jgi:hypothetical protein
LNRLSPRGRAVALAATSVILVLVAAVFSSRISFRPIDWQNYMMAASNLAGGRSPYQGVEFFGPPWLAMALIPFTWLPPGLSAMIWLLLAVGATYGISVLTGVWQGFPASERGRLVANIAAVVFPAALYVYITGQVTALAVLGMIVLGVRSRPSILWIALAALLASFKPHIVAAPLVLILLEHLRRRAWRVLAAFFGTLLVASLVSWVVVPPWLADWFAAISSEAFRGGPGLAAGGFFGLREAGVPGWLLALPLVYVALLWWRRGLTPITLATAIAGGLVWVPYVRSYDFLALWPAVLVASSAWRETRPAWFWLVPLALYAVLPLTDLALLLPVALFALLLGKTATDDSAASAPG